MERRGVSAFSSQSNTHTLFGTQMLHHELHVMTEACSAAIRGKLKKLFRPNEERAEISQIVPLPPHCRASHTTTPRYATRTGRPRARVAPSARVVPSERVAAVACESADRVASVLPPSRNQSSGFVTLLRNPACPSLLASAH